MVISFLFKRFEFARQNLNSDVLAYLQRNYFLQRYPLPPAFTVLLQDSPPVPGNLRD